MLQMASKLLMGMATNSQVTRMITAHTPVLSVVRQYSIFNPMDSDRLWEGVTGPTGQTKKRARGKRRVTRPKIDLNRGQIIGVGKQVMNWPGLTGELDSSVEAGKIDEEYEQRLITYRNMKAKKRSGQARGALQRGWTGAKRGGEIRFPPEGEPGVNLSEFRTSVIEAKMVSTMTATKGRTGQFSMMVVVGNQEGVGGIGIAKGKKMGVTINQASHRASHKLEYFDFYENRTLWHNAYKQNWHTKIFVKPMPEGYGLVCHRVLKTICQTIGIKDLYAKVEGSTSNYQQVAKTFFDILREQETFQELANREKLHVVERAADRDYYPRVLASPKEGTTRKVDSEEDLDLSRYYYGGRVPNIKVNPKPGYLQLPGQQKMAKIRHRYRNQPKARLERDLIEFVNLLELEDSEKEAQKDN